MKPYTERKDKVALFIDAENTRPDFNLLMQAVNQYGTIQEAMIYGNRSLIRDINRWRNEILRLNLKPVYTEKGMQNAADMTLIVDAMEVFLTQPEITTFIIVSMDSDFIPLIHKLRNAGKKVIGISSKYPPHMLRSAFNQYHTIVKPEWDYFEFSLHEFYVHYLNCHQIQGWVLLDEVLQTLPNIQHYLLRLKQMGYNTDIKFLKDSHWFYIWHDFIPIDKGKLDCAWICRCPPDVLAKPSDKLSKEMREYATSFYLSHPQLKSNRHINSLLSYWTD